MHTATLLSGRIEVQRAPPKSPTRTKSLECAGFELPMLAGLTLYPDGRKRNLILFSVTSGFVSILVLVIILDFKSINIIFIHLSV